MKLDYNILWIDDKIETRPFQSILARVKEYLSQLFFSCTIEQAEDFDNFMEIYAKKGEYDLIITDFTLNEGSTGKQVVDFIRDNDHNFTEIFFYSANRDVKTIDLINKNRITFYQLVEGSYKELEKEIKDVVSLTIKKFQHIVAMRGMIMNETSSLDLQMLEIIKLALKNDNIEFEELSLKIYDELINLYNTKNKFVNECKESGKFAALTKDNVVFSADYKIKTLGQILISLGLNDFSEKYKEEINSVRNKFAHAILLRDEKSGREYFKDGESGLTFDEELCKKIRMNIIKYKNNFTQIFEIINPS